MFNFRNFNVGNPFVTANVNVEDILPMFNRPLCGCGVMPPMFVRRELPIVRAPFAPVPFAHALPIEPTFIPQPCREPDGFDAHIDNPNPNNPRYWGWNGQERFITDKCKYENALDAVKRCNWPNREPIGAVNAPRFTRPFVRPSRVFPRLFDCAPVPARPIFEQFQPCGVFEPTRFLDDDWL